MAKCDYCGTTILFGGVRDYDLRFCNKSCHEKGYALVFSREIPQDIVDKQVEAVHQGLCPKCQGKGPVDVHTSHQIYSLLLFSSWKSMPSICCRACGIKSQIGNGLFSFLCGWWGIPWGLLLTPVQVLRNIIGIIKGPNGEKPSGKLENIIRVAITQQMMEEQEEIGA